MIKFNTNKLLVDIKGNPFIVEGKNVSFGEIITNCLTMTTKNPNKAYRLAKAFASTENVELDAADVLFIKDVINTSEFKAITAGQLFEELGETKEE